MSDEPFEVYRAEPKGAPRGGLILIHEIWGLVPHIRNIADRLAAEGYLVLAPDSAERPRASPRRWGLELAALMSSPNEDIRNAAQPRLREATAPARSPEFAAEATARLRTMVDQLELETGIDGRIGVLGFCFGGTYSFALAAADPRVKAAVPFYGTADVASIPDIACPVLALYGEQDTRLIGMHPEVGRAMSAANVDFHEQVYPDARARFNDTKTRAYRPEIAADASVRTPRVLRQAPGHELVNGQRWVATGFGGLDQLEFVDVDVPAPRSRRSHGRGAGRRRQPDRLQGIPPPPGRRSGVPADADRL